MLVPPHNQRLVVGSLVANLPIYLWHAIVNPPVVHPHQHVGIEVVIVLQSVRLTSHLGRTLLVAIDAEGRHTELHPRLHLLDALAHLLDEHVHVVAAPVAFVLESVVVLGELLVVGNLLTGSGIRIEIVVDMDSIHVIAAHDVLHHLTDIVAVGGDAWVQDTQAVVREYSFGMGDCDMIVGKHRRPLGAGTIGIEPRMQLHPTLVALLHHPIQRVPIGRGSLTLHTRQETAPRLVFAFVERVALRAHLEDDGVHPILLQFVELASQLLLYGHRALTLELAIHTLNPRPAELAFRGRARVVVGVLRCTRSQQGYQH